MRSTASAPTAPARQQVVDLTQVPPGARNDWSRFGVVLAAVVTTAACYAWILTLQMHGRSAAALDMPEMGMTDVGRYWAFPMLEASGLVGLAFAYVSVLLGLQPSIRWRPTTYRQVNGAHRHVALVVVGLVLVHVAATVLDGMGNTWQTVLVPGYVGTQGWPAAIWGFNGGIFAVYALLLLGPTFYLRRWTGVRRWRFLHRFVLVFYGLSIWHALVLGLDVSYYGWIRPTIWLAQIPLLAMVIARTRRSPTPVRQAIVTACCVGIGAVVAIVATGNSGFIHTV
jgi:sulfoxide reductase heme-binding subunit YedZ